MTTSETLADRRPVARPLHLVAVLLGLAGCSPGGEPIKVGILHSFSGTMSQVEPAVAEATLLAVERINAEGGLLGRRVESVVADGRSDWSVFADEADRLITTDGVSVIFGCWTSACRKVVGPVVERHDHLMFYPLQYEGLEQSPNILYTGAAPNQQIIPAVKWSFDNLGRRFFLVASDYVFPRAANEIIRDHATALGADIVGEEYVLLGSADVSEMVAAIVATRPDVILNTINGETNAHFFRELRAAGITPDVIPTMSFSIAEDELRQLGAELVAGDYAAWSYFQSVESEENERFVSDFRERFGPDRVTAGPMEAAYVGVLLWAAAVDRAGTTNPADVRAALSGLTLQAPGGLVVVDPTTNHLWKTVRIGRAREDGQFEIIWTSDGPQRPGPFPGTRSRLEWQGFLDSLSGSWGGRWENPGG